MKKIPIALALVAAVIVCAELLVVPLELYVDNLSQWWGYGFIWSMARFREWGDIAVRWDIVSFEVCVTITTAFVAYALVPRNFQQSS